MSSDWAATGAALRVWPLRDHRADDSLREVRPYVGRHKTGPYVLAAKPPVIGAR